MVYTYLSGRIGNNLFQIATGASLAFRNNTNFIACIKDTWCEEPDNCYLEDYLKQFKTNLLRKIEFTKGTPVDAVIFNQVTSVEQIPYFNKICLHGIWQSENYFKKEQDYIRQLFSIDEETERFIKAKYNRVFEEEIISIVVRRGDYCKQPQFHPTCSMRYFNSAMNYFGKDNRFLIISDDIEWCKTKFKGDNYFFSDHDSPFVDLYLQTYCSHNIISNSSFAWWGAWLNPNTEKKVIAPKNNWYGYFYKEFFRPDMLPKEWILLPNPLSFSHRIIVLKAILIDLVLPIKHAAEKIIKRKIKFT
jgi:hypothetical protein